MNILIVGGNGFIGSHLIDELLKRGNQVRVFDVRPERFRSPLPHVDYRISTLENIPEIYEALMGIDLVFYLASASVPSTSNVDTISDVKKNIIPVLNLLNIMEKLGIRRIVYFSSGGAIYGNPLYVPLDEDHPKNPISSYGIVKLTIEKYLELYQNLHNIDPLIIRPSNPFGPRQGHFNAQGVISTFLYRIKCHEPIIVFGNGDTKKDYIYVQDLISDCVDLTFSGVNGIYNIGSGQGISLNEIIATIKNITQKDFDIQRIEKKSYDVDQFVLDISRLKQVIGNKENTDITDGIAKTWEWIQSSED
jgi:UDP-glucose 4-epimerase